MWRWEASSQKKWSNEQLQTLWIHVFSKQRVEIKATGKKKKHRPNMRNTLSMKIWITQKAVFWGDLQIKQVLSFFFLTVKTFASGQDPHGSMKKKLSKREFFPLHSEVQVFFWSGVGAGVLQRNFHNRKIIFSRTPKVRSETPFRSPAPKKHLKFVDH